MAPFRVIQLNCLPSIIVAAAAVVSMEAVNQPRILSTLSRVESIIFTLNIFIADSLFLYRCYVIWKFQWKITVLPTALMISTFVVAICGVHRPITSRTCELRMVSAPQQI
ncbi:hypothetical protein K438DRAFT_1869634 [Mycena galopus ATCC 62051]|nr:hypothetical protein K438DRAFT_1869634 [Mycena galopus ATCC 62051]